MKNNDPPKNEIFQMISLSLISFTNKEEADNYDNQYDHPHRHYTSSKWELSLELSWEV